MLGMCGILNMMLLIVWYEWWSDTLSWQVKVLRFVKQSPRYQGHKCRQWTYQMFTWWNHFWTCFWVQSTTETFESLTLFLNPKVLPDLGDKVVESPHVQDKGDQINYTQYMSVSDTTTRNTTKSSGTNWSAKPDINQEPAICSTHPYNLWPHKPVTYMNY